MNMKKNIILKEMVPYLMLAPALIIILIFKIFFPKWQSIFAYL